MVAHLLTASHPAPRLPLALPPDAVSAALAQGRSEARRNGWDVDDIEGCEGFIARLDGEEIVVYVRETEEMEYA